MATLQEALAIEKLAPGRFKSVNNPMRIGNTLPIAFGGYTISIAVQAAHQDIPSTHRIYAVHGNFLGPAFTDRPVIISTKTYRATKTFTTKAVEVSQKQDDGAERVCLVALVDFHVIEKESVMVYSSPPSKDYSSVSDSQTPESRKKTMVAEGILSQKKVDQHDKMFGQMQHLVDMRFTPQSVHGQNLQGFATGLKTTQSDLPLTSRTSADWLRVREPLSTPAQHATSLAFLLDASISFQPLVLDSRALTDVGACSTLEFSLRFLTPEIDANGWCLREWRTFAGDAARTFSEARLWDEAGKMVASMSQTSIMRPAKKKGEAKL